jgi:hypothetical protein
MYQASVPRLTNVFRIFKPIAFIRGISPDRIDGTEDKEIVLPVAGRETRYKGMQLLLGHSMPNVYFRAPNAYNILRHIGIEIGKRDFLTTHKPAIHDCSSVLDQFLTFATIQSRRS